MALTREEAELLDVIRAANLGAELRRRRNEAGWSIGELGVWMGRSASTIGRWERGETEPSVSEVRQILQLLRGPKPILTIPGKANASSFQPRALPEAA